MGHGHKCRTEARRTPEGLHLPVYYFLFVSHFVYNKTKNPRLKCTNHAIPRLQDTIEVLHIKLEDNTGRRTHDENYRVYSLQTLETKTDVPLSVKAKDEKVTLSSQIRVPVLKMHSNGKLPNYKCSLKSLQ